MLHEKLGILPSLFLPASGRKGCVASSDAVKLYADDDDGLTR